MPSTSAMSVGGITTMKSCTSRRTPDPKRSESGERKVVRLRTFSALVSPLVPSMPFTKVPEPRLRATRPRAASSSIARFTVILLTP